MADLSAFGENIWIALVSLARAMICWRQTITIHG
jgi:hypothetical protein